MAGRIALLFSGVSYVGPVRETIKGVMRPVTRTHEAHETQQLLLTGLISLVIGPTHIRLARENMRIGQ